MKVFNEKYPVAFLSLYAGGHLKIHLLLFAARNIKIIFPKHLIYGKIF